MKNITLIKKFTKLVVIALAALVFAYASDRISEPPQSQESLEYQKRYNSLADKSLSEEEFEKLRQDEKKYLAELYSPENMRKDLRYVAKRKLVLVPIALILWFFIGLKFGVTDRIYLIVITLSVGICSYLYVNIIESISYAALFLIGNLILMKRKVRV